MNTEVYNSSYKALAMLALCSLQRFSFYKLKLIQCILKALYTFGSCPASTLGVYKINL